MSGLMLVLALGCIWPAPSNVHNQLDELVPAGTRKEAALVTMRAAGYECEEASPRPDMARLTQRLRENDHLLDPSSRDAGNSEVFSSNFLSCTRLYVGYHLRVFIAVRPDGRVGAATGNSPYLVQGATQGI